VIFPMPVQTGPGDLWKNFAKPRCSTAFMANTCRSWWQDEQKGMSERGVRERGRSDLRQGRVIKQASLLEKNGANRTAGRARILGGLRRWQKIASPAEIAGHFDPAYPI